jgi:hypothetical protein
MDEPKPVPKYGRGTGVPNPTDVHVGGPGPGRRLLLVGFANRSATSAGSNTKAGAINQWSRLSAMAEILSVPISYFFGDLQPDDADLSAEDRQWREQLQRPETIEFIRLYYAISDQKIRRQFLEMAKTVAESFAARAD